MSQPTVAAAAEAASATPLIVVGPYSIDAAAAVTIASAAPGAGMGAYDFSATTLTLRLPPSVYAQSYRSTVLVTVINGP